MFYNARFYCKAQLLNTSIEKTLPLEQSRGESRVLPLGQTSSRLTSSWLWLVSVFLGALTHRRHRLKLGPCLQELNLHEV